jgi:alpha-L-rhamnosidase
MDTMGEHWDGLKDGKVTGSLNHYAFGAVMGFVYRRLGGIDCAEPGFLSLAVRPIFSSRLDGFGAEYHAATGRIATRWQRKGGKTTFEVTVPANVSAEVQLPDRRVTVGSGIHSLTI